MRYDCEHGIGTSSDLTHHGFGIPGRVGDEMLESLLVRVGNDLLHPLLFRRSVWRRPRRYFRAVEIDGRVVMKNRSKRRVKAPSLRLIARRERVALASVPFDLRSWWAVAHRSFSLAILIVCASLNLTKSNYPVKAVFSNCFNRFASSSCSRRFFVIAMARWISSRASESLPIFISRSPRTLGKRW